MANLLLQNCWGSGVGCVLTSAGRVRCSCYTDIPQGQVKCLMQDGESFCTQKNYEFRKFRFECSILLEKS